METAAKSLQFLSQRVLPELPHTLSNSSDWRYRPPVVEPKKYMEELENHRLQYMTLISHAEREPLLTRSYHDMRVEQRPAHRDISSLAKAGPEKKKLSLSDYKNKKTTGAVADTPPEPASARRRDGAHDKVKPSPDPVSKADAHRSRDAHPAANSKPAVDMSLPARPSTLPPRPASPEPRKRLADPDDDSRSQKRSRTDVRSAHDDAVRQSRDEAPRRKDRDSLAPSDHRSDRDREGRFSTPSSLTNGRNVLKNSTSSARNPSPAGRARGSSVNGVRPAHPVSAKNTPTKVDISSRPSLPPLLSPLHLNLDSRDADRDKKRAREDAVDGTKPTKPKKLEEPPRQRRERSPARLPPLLSPTLPPLIESELFKRGKVGAKGDKNKEIREKEERHDMRSSDERHKEERSSTGRKSRPEQDEEEPVRKERQKSLLVTLSIPRPLRARVRNLLAQPPARKEPPAANSEVQSGQAKKRPAAASETIADSISVKRPRTSSMSQPNRLPPPPSTPSKRGTTAMSRVSSSNSQVHTPGDVTSATPAPLASAERPVNGNDGSRQSKLEDAAAQEKEHQRFSNLGRHLKHNGDIVMKKAAVQAANGSREMDSSYKLGYVLSVESILAFMTGFQALNMNRQLLGKVRDSKGWESLFPLLEFLQRAFRADLRRYRILYTLILMLHAVTVEEVIKCYTTYDNPANHVTLQALIQHERNRMRLWQLVREANAAIDTDYLCANMTPWSTIDDISASVLRVLRRWCEDENVKWVPEMNARNADSRNHRN